MSLHCRSSAARSAQSSHSEASYVLARAQALRAGRVAVLARRVGLLEVPALPALAVRSEHGPPVRVAEALAQRRQHGFGTRLDAEPAVAAACGLTGGLGHEERTAHVGWVCGPRARRRIEW